ncbi:MAG: FliM/FliN family flagellar motor switch protein [Steroidobacteraceae bacterium]|nr:FliM/FliN family flagellar motor switch protein [Steroidobacteraceae bacterium]
MDVSGQRQIRERLTSSPRPHRILDPRTLGRPVHLTDRFTARVREDIAEELRVRFNRRYRASFEVGEVAFERRTEPGLRWRMFGSSTGRVGFSIARDLVACVLRYRYGLQPDEPLEPETSGEERLVSMLGAQFTGILVRSIDALLPHSERSATGELTEVPGAAPIEGGWLLRVDVTEPTRKTSGRIHFLLEESWVAKLLRGLTPTREHLRTPRAAAAAATQPLPARLHLTLTARLLEKELPLGKLLDTRVGDVIPVSLPRTDVLIGDSRLFTASIAEHKGKLCLTSFEDVE